MFSSSLSNPASGAAVVATRELSSAVESRDIATIRAALPTAVRARVARNDVDVAQRVLAEESLRALASEVEVVRASLNVLTARACGSVVASKPGTSSSDSARWAEEIAAQVEQRVWLSLEDHLAASVRRSVQKVVSKLSPTRCETCASLNRADGRAAVKQRYCTEMVMRRMDGNLSKFHVFRAWCSVARASCRNEAICEKLVWSFPTVIASSVLHAWSWAARLGRHVNGSTARTEAPLEADKSRSVQRGRETGKDDSNLSIIAAPDSRSASTETGDAYDEFVEARRKREDAGGTGKVPDSPSMSASQSPSRRSRLDARSRPSLMSYVRENGTNVSAA